MSFSHKNLEGLSWALQGAGAKEPQERVGGQHLAPFNSPIARMQSGARKWGKPQPGERGGHEWADGQSKQPGNRKCGTGPVQLSLKKRWEETRMKKVCKVLRGTDEASSLSYYKTQEASKEASCIVMNSIPFLEVVSIL